MGNHPVLKPREVVKILEKMGFSELDKKAPTNNTDIKMGGEQLYHFIKEGIFPPFY